jgi:hypothetical protein
VQLTIDDLRHQVVWQLDEIVVGGWPIERRHSRHRLHHTSSFCMGDADGAWRE